MGTAIARPGAILRRGADRLTAAELSRLMDNPEEVDRIIKDINARREVYLKTESDAKAELERLEGTQKALAEGEAALAEGEAALVSGRAEAAEKHASDMEALGRRTKEVLEKESAQAERKTEVDIREQEVVRLMTQAANLSVELSAWVEANPINPKEKF